MGGAGAGAENAERAHAQVQRAEGQLRSVLLQGQPPVCARAGRAVRDVSPRGGAAQTATAAALRVPPGAALARRVGVSLRAGAGRAPRLAAAQPIRCTRVISVPGGYI